MLKVWRAALAATMALACVPALAGDNYTVQSGGQQRQVRAKEVSGVLHPVFIPFDVNGVPLFTQTNVGYVAIGAPLPAGTNVIGGVTISGTLPLPTGAATAANQGTTNTSLGSIDTKLPAQVSGRVPVDGSGVTQPVSAAALPLPTGAATAGNQTTANASLASIDTKTPAQVGGRLPVDGSGVTQPVSAASLPLPSGAATAANQTTANTSLATIAGAVVAATPPGEAHIGQVGGHAAVLAASITRPANTTVYAVGQLVANSTTAGSVSYPALPLARVTGGSGILRRVRLTTSSTSLTNASFRAHFYRTSSGGACPTYSNGDGGAYLSDAALLYLGKVDITLDQAFTDGAKGIGTPAVGSEITFEAAAGQTGICWALEARAAYTPTSAGTFTLAVETHQN